MNKAYKVVYNESTGTYVAVSELETSKGKATSISNNTTEVSVNTPKSLTGRFVLGKLALSLLGLSTLFAMPLAHASYTAGGGVLQGTVLTRANNAIAIGSDGSTGSGSAATVAAGANGAIAIGGGASASAADTVAIGNSAKANLQILQML